MVIFPENWTPAAQEAYDQASLMGDSDRQAAIILQETEEVVNFDDGSLVKLIEVRTADYAPV